MKLGPAPHRSARGLEDKGKSKAKLRIMKNTMKKKQVQTE